MSKLISFNSEARASIKKGLDTLAEAVKVTLGPQGQNVIIEQPYGPPHITKDGVTVAKAIELKDPFENIGAQLIREVSSKTCDDAGDGTTTSSVLTQAIVSEGIKSIETGTNPIYLKKGMHFAVSKIVDFIKNHSIKVDNDYDKIAQVASISANNDPEIGQLIADAFSKVSIDGVITIEESKNADTYTSIINGIQLDRGFVSPYFANTAESMECTLEDSYILLYNDKLNNIKSILPILEYIVESNKSLLIVSNDIDQEVVTTLVANKIKNNLKICAIKSPGFGDAVSDNLQDLATLTGGAVISESFNHGISRVNATALGYAKKIIIDKNTTTIIGGGGNSNVINEQAEILKIAYKENPTPELQERIAKLAGGIGVIYVGANSEVELKEKKDRVEDALCATRAALEEGIVPGGGSIYIKSLKALNTILRSPNEEEQRGINIIKRAIIKPLYTIAENAGVSGDVVVKEVSKSKELIGYDAKNNKYVDMLEQGIIDPTKVVRVSLENALSVASLIITTRCIICNKNILNQ